MQWKDILTDFEKVFGEFEKANLPFPVIPEVKTSLSWQECKDGLREWEWRAREKIDGACAKYVLHGLCPKLDPPELYLMMQRFDTAILLLKVLGAPHTRDIGFDVLRYPNFLAVPYPDTPHHAREWLLVSGWSYFGDRCWLQRIELHLYRKSGDPQGTPP